MTSSATEAPAKVGGPALVLQDLSKTFGSVRVLHDVSLRIEPGEIRGLVGRNGSGKSTLIKILAGYHAPDRGAKLEVAGEEVPLPVGPGEARRHRLTFVHQDLGLVPQTSIIDNVLVGRFRSGSFSRIHWKSEGRRISEAFQQFGLALDPKALVGELRQVEQALVAIVRSFLDLAGEPGVLVLDEPTAFLPQADVDLLFSAVREVAAQGTAVIYVSHRIEEVLELTDNVSVLRDGHLVATRAVDSITRDELVELILGEKLGQFYPALATHTGNVVFSARDIEGQLLHGVSLDLRAGEVVGVTGLTGDGYDELPYVLYGAKSAKNGEISIGNVTLEAASLLPSTAIAQGLAFLPGDRQRASSAQSMTVLENVSLPVLKGYAPRGRLRHRAERNGVEALLREFEVTPPDGSRVLSELSGGNQQKALLAKWLQTAPRVLLLHEPTQGVDVGSKQEIFRRIEEAAQGGAAVLIASAEFEDLAHLCHRVLILRNGRIVNELSDEVMTSDRIADQAFRAEIADDAPPLLVGAKNG